ncbi:MAG TPA: phage tail sheath subtilisin-like domain-containing protein [Mycobacterium sp.]|jgi:phage tail sheath protein FI|nr:phage tail sheath subtilisin-like domain-containing protein [Mycobacterium sp.]
MPTYTAPGVFVEEVPATAPIVGVGTSTPVFIGVWADGASDPNPSGTVIPIFNITKFKTAFGDFTAPPGTGQTLNAGLNTLGHAVKGFFENGGTFCYAVRAKVETDIGAVVLPKLEAFDDISMVVAPGVPAATASMTAVTDIVTHCRNMGDRIAILDAPANATSPTQLAPLLPTGGSAAYQATDFAALYTPWLVVFDDATKGEKTVPPSGHIAGIYSRVDATRGVHKAPANEQLFGVLRPSVQIGKTGQGTINPQGGNCIRMLNGAIKVWGARTLAGDTSLHKYVPIRRLLSFLYKSIDHGTQWAVFEPNGPDLWARIIRNVGSFLTNVWSQGALAGAVPEEAFYIKCDDENNPPDQRASGLLIVEVGVATVFPAEFVVFRIQQFTGPIR